MIRLIRSHPRAAAVFALALVLVLLAALHLGQTLWRLGASRDEGRALAGWMTPRYIVHHFDIDRAALAAALGLGAGDEPNLTLTELARRAGVPPEELLARIEALRPSPPEDRAP